MSPAASAKWQCPSQCIAFAGPSERVVPERPRSPVVSLGSALAVSAVSVSSLSPRLHVSTYQRPASPQFHAVNLLPYFFANLHLASSSIPEPITFDIHRHPSTHPNQSIVDIDQSSRAINRILPTMPPTSRRYSKPLCDDYLISHIKPSWQHPYHTAQWPSKYGGPRG